jgi:uncharacterized protein YkwD
MPRDPNPPTVEAATGPTDMRQNPLWKLALISAITAPCCTGCGDDSASTPLPPLKTPASSPRHGPQTTPPRPTASAPPLAPLTVSTETPLVADVVKIFNTARQQGGLPALKMSPNLQEIAKAQVKVEIESHPGVMTKSAPKKKAKSEAITVAERAAKLGYRYRDLKEITTRAAGPVVTVLTGYLQDPKNEFHKAAFGDWTEFAVAEGRDEIGLPYISVIFGTPEPGHGVGKGAAGASKESTRVKADAEPAEGAPKADLAAPKAAP